jgi:hypothetical protein
MSQRPARLATTVHAFIPGADGDCWCQLPRDNRHHQVEPAGDDVTSRILGEHPEDGDQ